MVLLRVSVGRLNEFQSRSSGRIPMTRLTCLVMAASLIFLQFVAADDDVKKDQKDNVKPPPAATLTTADIYRIATEAKKEIKSVQVSYDTSQTKLLDLP